MKDTLIQIYEALDNEGGLTVAQIVLGFLQELPVTIHDAIDVPSLSAAIEDYIVRSIDS